MTGEHLLHLFFEETRIWLKDGGVHYRPCPHRGQPHFRSDEPCVWMSAEAARAFLTWAVQKGYVTPSWVRGWLRHGRLHEASRLADAAAAMWTIRPDRAAGLVVSVQRSLLPTMLVGLALGLLLGYRRGGKR